MNTTNTFSWANRMKPFFHLSSFSISACLSIVLISSTMTTSAFAVDNKDTATNAGVSALPPLSSSSSIPPNIIISFDNSASMLLPAYDDTDFGWRKPDGSHDDFDPGTTYYGYFEAVKYSYDSTNGWFIADTSGAWNGNFLNWATMRRVDIARKALIGGKVRRARTTANDTYTSVRTAVTVGADTFWVLEAQKDTLDADRDTFVKVEDLNDKSKSISAYTPYRRNTKFWIKQGTISVAVPKLVTTLTTDASGNTTTTTTLVMGSDDFNIHIALKNTAEPTGFLQTIKNANSRVGSAVFNYDHRRPIDGTTNGIYRGNTSTHGGTLYPCYADLANTTPTNHDVCLPTHVKAPLDNTVRVIEEYPLIWGTTPIAETMYTIYGYVSQTDHGLSHNTGQDQTPAGPHFFRNGQDRNLGKPSYQISNDWDPFYYTEYSSKVECCNVHIININDGGSYNDWDDADDDMPAALTTGDLGLDVDGDGDPAAADTGDKKNTEFVDDLALYLRKTDIRPDLTGHQEIFNYFLFAALGGAVDDDIRKMKESAANGAFVDYDGDHLPDVAHPADFLTYTSSCTANEWDLNADCTPDGFFNVDSGAALVLALNAAFSAINKQVSAGTSAAVLANSTDGVGTIYHSLYQPESKDANGNIITWGGILNALFIDKNGYIREDNPTNGTLGTLDSYAQDRILDLYYDTTLEKTLVQHYSGFDGSGNKIADGGPVSLDQLNSIWEARDALANVPFSATNRSFSATAQTGRYIVTQLPSIGLVPLEATEFDGTRVVGPFTVSEPEIFGLAPVTEALAGAGATGVTNIINYIRGQEDIPGFRNRSIKFGKNTNAKPWLLGDIIHSTPGVVGPPDKNYNLLYGDATYLAFQNKYANRRQMIYVGANDGMLHAFNGGFFNSQTEAYTTTPTGLTDHALGTEIWAYIPLATLPHLQWLISPNYQHTFYVDGAPFIFDARIWPTDNLDTDTHPKGWGTLMAVTMRLGGKPFTVDLEGDGLAGANTDTDAADDKTLASAIAIFDITDPEAAPILLHEFTPTDIGFTTSKPNLIVQHLANTTDFTFNTPSKNKWYLAFGSGPNDLNTVTRNDNVNAKLYILHLDADIANATGTRTYETKDTGLLNHFLGDTQIVDWVQDYNYDTLYVGAVGGDVASPTGQLLRLDLGARDGPTFDALFPSRVLDTPVSTWAASTLYKVITPAALPGGGQPFVNRPIEAFDIKRNAWVYAGTGRLLTGNDILSESPQSFYGVKETLDPTSGLPTDDAILASELQDVSGVRVFSNGGILDPKDVIAGTQPDTTIAATVDTFTELETSIESKRGWVINFEPNPSVAGTASTRNTSAAAYFSQLTIFSSYSPDTDNICSVLGSSSLHVVYGRTGTAYPNTGLGNQACGGCLIGDPDETLSSISVGAGQASETIVHRGTAITNLGTGAISTNKIIGVPVKTGRQSWREFDELPAIAK